MLKDQKHHALGDYCIWYVLFGFKSGSLVVCEKGSPEDVITSRATRELGFSNSSEYCKCYPKYIKQLGFSTQKDYFTSLPNSKFWASRQPYNIEPLHVMKFPVIWDAMIRDNVIPYPTVEEVIKCGYDITPNEMWFCKDWNV